LAAPDRDSGRIRSGGEHTGEGAARTLAAPDRDSGRIRSGGEHAGETQPERWPRQIVTAAGFAPAASTPGKRSPNVGRARS